MSASKVELLRLMMPPAHACGDVPLRCAWRSSDGHWHSTPQHTLQALGDIATLYHPKRLEVCPHPCDISMTEAELPPLPLKRLGLAVRGTVELMALLPPEELAIGFGPRHPTGKLPMAWMSAAHLAQMLHTLQQHGLHADAVLPPPAFLPAPGESDSDGEPRPVATAMCVDSWVVMRTGPDTGLLHPLPGQCNTQEQVDARVQPLLAQPGPLQWLQADPAAPAPWTGTNWEWNLPLPHSGARAAQQSRLGPVLAWVAAALLVWLAGLNLHAQRMAAQGQALKQQMAAQVQAAFPELPIVLQPLQQARQLRDARRSGALPATPDFSALLRASTALLMPAAGQVQSVDYQGGQMEIRWRDGAALLPSEIEALQAQAREKGLQLESDTQALRLRADAPGPQHSTAAQESSP